LPGMSFMPRRSAVGIAVAVGLVVPTMAAAGFPGVMPNDYEGKIEHDNSTGFGFDVDHVGGSRVAHNFDLLAVPVNCHDGSSQRANILNTIDDLPVVNRHFEGKFKHGDTKLKVAGDLLSEGRARGVMSWNTDDGTDAGTCYSGVLGWSATRNT
jgi:hypothetical protein